MVASEDLARSSVAVFCAMVLSGMKNLGGVGVSKTNHRTEVMQTTIQLYGCSYQTLPEARPSGCVGLYRPA